MRKPRIYIAGPMRGLADLNYPTFNHAARKLRGMGWHVENPAEIGEGLGTPEKINSDPALLAAVMAADIHALETCDAIFLLPGWQDSIGARKELRVVLDNNKPIFLAPDYPHPGIRQP